MSQRKSTKMDLNSSWEVLRWGMELRQFHIEQHTVSGVAKAAAYRRGQFTEVKLNEEEP